MLRRIGLALAAAILVGIAAASASAATVGPSLQSKLSSLADSASAGVVIIAFNTDNGLQPAHLDVLRGVGLFNGTTLPSLGMVALPATAGQVRALAANPAVRSVWSNDQLFRHMEEARTVTGVERLTTDAALTFANGGLPVSGAGNFAVVVNDSGIDATHSDLAFGSKVIENVQILTDTETLTGFTPLLAVSGIPNTDSHVGHGTHCAGIIGGTGQASGGRYAGVAPGARIIGCGSGAGLFVLNALGGLEWTLTNRTLYNIRVVSNSWGGSGAFDPNDPINIATKKLYDRNIVVVFSAGNSGPGPDTHNPSAKAPWVISVAAGTKEGGLAGFSSRGIPREERLNNSDPNDDFDAPTITAPGTGREFETNAAKFTAAIVSTRAISNVVANGTTDDAELPPAFVPFYTQISGTSMSCPFIAGVVALMLDADPTLSVDEIKSILTSTATRMPGYEDFEVGAGYVNAYAAVDKVFNRSKAYGTVSNPVFNARLTTTPGAFENFTIDFTPAEPGPTSPNTYHFQVEPGLGSIDVRIDFGTNVVTDEVGNSLGLQLYAPDGRIYTSGLTLPALDSARREIIVDFPVAGNWTAEVRGLRGLAAAPVSSPFGIAVPEQVNGIVKRFHVTLQDVPDIAGHPAEAQIRAALLSRRMDVLATGEFQPDARVTRLDFAQHLTYNTPLRQTALATRRYLDVPAALAPTVDSVTAKGSTLRDYTFTPQGMMAGTTATTFGPDGLLKRIELAVALVRALGLDVEAQALAGQNVTASGNGQTLVLADNAEIPAALRGYVQIALDRQLLQAFFALEQGPFDFTPSLKARVKPNDPTTRAFLAFAFANFGERFAGR